ncbi:hypothetical protein LH495_29660, partial [Klebsiella pneumoniae]|uniref:hypothetical protein n=1 Tax=Klebsiella pneumoniae TaxID=573 RepID=UPI001E6166D0
MSKSLVGFDLHHDNQPIMYFDATHVVGTIGGSFDDDFFQEGISYITNKGSSGQKSGSRLNSILSVMAYGEGFPLKFAGEEKINSRRTRNDKLDESIKQIEKHIISKSQKTIILDEPENHLDLKSTIGFWKLVH